jgi:CDP-diacylglycerol---glycerol-3-phosphate 3-phosphatidyltransferase
MPDSIRTDLIITAYYRAMQRHLAVPMQRAGVTPNQLAAIRIAIAFLVPAGFGLHPLGGLVLIVVSGIADSLDGYLARHRNQVCAFGMFVDTTLDRVSDFFYLAGFWVVLWIHQPYRFPATLLMVIALFATLMTSYTKARAESLGVECHAGIMDRRRRVGFLIGWAVLIVVLPGSKIAILWIGFILYLGLTLTTVMQRILHVHLTMLRERRHL